MDVEYPGFGSIVVEGDRFDHDVVVDSGEVRKRRKGPSRSNRSEYGHTPLSAAEELPWAGPQLVIGTGFSGSLPITPDVWAEAESRGVEIIAVPTAEACGLLAPIDVAEVNAVLHVTC